MGITILGKHKCPQCSERFRKYNTKRSTERIDRSDNFYVYWVDTCPHCGYIYNKGKFTIPGNRKIKDFVKEIEGD